MPRSRRRRRRGTLRPASGAEVTHEKEIEIRWRDLDAFNHVNHVVFLTYLEEVRDERLGRVLEDTALGGGYVIGRIEIDNRPGLTLEDDVVVAAAPPRRVR